MCFKLARKIVTFTKLVVSSLFGWLVLVPLALAIPKKRQIVFLEQDSKRFYDNVKYFYLYLCRQSLGGIRCIYLTRNKELCTVLKKRGLPVAMENSLRGKCLMLRAKVAVEDGLGLASHLKSFFLFAARKVQLWHGIPIKKIQLQAYQRCGFVKRTLPRLFWTFVGRYPFYHVLVSSSEACTQNYRGAFRCAATVEMGYPRNDLFFQEHNESFMLGAHEAGYERIKALKGKGYKISLYMPTFRDSGGDAVSDGALDLCRLADFGKKHHIAFVLKFHANVKTTVVLGAFAAENLVLYDNSRDIYPVFSLTDLLITDYSSVFFDFLLLDKPMLFFKYDYEKYVQKDREMLLDYDSVIAGPRCQTQDELERELKGTLCEGIDRYIEKRREIRELFWKHVDGEASTRIWNLLKGRFLS